MTRFIRFVFTRKLHKMYFGQFDGASYGDLINFLEDNSGCVEAIKDWIAEQNVDEWKENLESELEIPDGHVFWN